MPVFAPLTTAIDFLGVEDDDDDAICIILCSTRRGAR
jgi:hypothetical protein